MDDEQVHALIKHTGSTIVLLALLMLGTRHLNDILGETTVLGETAGDLFFAITAGLIVAKLAYPRQIRFFQPEDADAIDQDMALILDPLAMPA